MRIETDRGGELEVPQAIIRDWEKSKEHYGDIEEFIRDNVWDYLRSQEGKLMDKDIVIFLHDYETGHIPPWGGHCADNHFSFKGGKSKYTVLAFGWNDENGEPDIHMIGYKVEL
ncbi:MAG: hypothetical protein A2Z28_07670 [Chloroflexi bacterium RBG_16_51_9]|nr:MAG: hypothetical protein A2Z28_07670 [Chloroflexi bacterium RBG_16_51_9]